MSPSEKISWASGIEPGLHTAYIGVVGTIGDVECRGLFSIKKDGLHQSDVREMGATSEGVVRE